MWGGYMGYGPWGAGGFFMMLFMGLFWIILVIGAGTFLWTVLRKGSAGAAPQGSGSALRILEERYARGEIDKDEFEQKRRDLQH